MAFQAHFEGWRSHGIANKSHLRVWNGHDTLLTMPPNDPADAHSESNNCAICKISSSTDLTRDTRNLPQQRQVSADIDFKCCL
eukprot:6177855-Amphidinium_carterae.1